MQTPYFRIVSRAGHVLYVSASRLIRLLSQRPENKVFLFFEGFMVSIETKDGNADDLAGQLWAKNIPGPHRIDLTNQTAYVESVDFS
jgi:hypothetical protein